MNRKGSLEWNLETIGKLILYAIIFVGIVILVMKLFGLLSHGEAEIRATRNFEYLTKRIEYVDQNKADGPEASVILSMPSDYLIIAYSSNRPSISLKGSGMASGRMVADASLETQCKGKTCLCLMSASVEGSGGSKNDGELLLEKIDCRDYEFTKIQGTLASFDFERFGRNPTYAQQTSGSWHGVPTYEFAFSSVKPTNINITIERDTLLLDALP